MSQGERCFAVETWVRRNMKSHESWHGFKIHWNTETVVARVSHAKWTCSRDEEAQQFLFLHLWPFFDLHSARMLGGWPLVGSSKARTPRATESSTLEGQAQHMYNTKCTKSYKDIQSMTCPNCPHCYTFVTHLWNNERHWLPSPDHQLQVTPTAVRRRSPPEIPRNLWPPTLELATPWQSLLCQGMTD